MTRILTTAAAIFALATPGVAQVANAMVDDNDDGVYSYDELADRFPDLSPDGFDALDTDDSGFIEQGEALQISLFDMDRLNIDGYEPVQDADVVEEIDTTDRDDDDVEAIGAYEDEE